MVKRGEYSRADEIRENEVNATAPFELKEKEIDLDIIVAEAERGHKGFVEFLDIVSKRLGDIINNSEYRSFLQEAALQLQDELRKIKNKEMTEYEDIYEIVTNLVEKTSIEKLKVLSDEQELEGHLIPETGGTTMDEQSTGAYSINEEKLLREKSRGEVGNKEKIIFLEYFLDGTVTVEGMRYQFIEKLGKGARKEVSRVRAENGEELAFAIIALESIPNKYAKKAVIEEIKNEFATAKALSNIDACLTYRDVAFYNEDGQMVSGENVEEVYFITLTSDIIEGKQTMVAAYEMRSEVIGDVGSIRTAAIERIKNNPDILEQAKRDIKLVTKVNFQMDAERERQNGSIENEAELFDKKLYALVLEQEMKKETERRVETDYTKVHEQGLKLLSSMKSVAKGLDEMGELGYAHNDLKPENIFNGDNGGIIGDFGVTTKVRQPFGDELYGTPLYLEPGIFSANYRKFAERGRQVAHDKRAFAQSMLNILCPAIDLPSIPFHPPEVNEKGETVLGSDILYAQGVRYFTEERKKKFDFLVRFFVAELNMPVELARVFETSDDPEKIERERTISNTEIMAHIINWVESMDLDTYKVYKEKIMELKDPATYNRPYKELPKDNVISRVAGWIGGAFKKKAA